MQPASRLLPWAALFLVTACSAEPDIEFLMSGERLCSSKWGDFADDHRGQVVTFDATVARARFTATVETFNAEDCILDLDLLSTTLR